MIIEEGGIKVEEFSTENDGRKNYQLTLKTESFTHIAFMVKVDKSLQTREKLLEMAWARIGKATTK